MPEQNTITGPDGQIFRPREVPTGLASHVKFVVREYELFNLELERMVENCQRSSERASESDSGAQERSDLLGIVLALGRRSRQGNFDPSIPFPDLPGDTPAGGG